VTVETGVADKVVAGWVLAWDDFRLYLDWWTAGVGMMLLGGLAGVFWVGQKVGVGVR